jgi:hypothetical protein
MIFWIVCSLVRIYPLSLVQPLLRQLVGGAVVPRLERWRAGMPTTSIIANPPVADSIARVTTHSRQGSSTGIWSLVMQRGRFT